MDAPKAHGEVLKKLKRIKKKKKKKKKELDSPVIPEVAVLSCGHPLPVLAAHHCCCDSECEDNGYKTTKGELKDNQRVWGTVKVVN